MQFGVESKLDLNYWWAKGTMPLPDNIINQIKQLNEKNDNPCEKSNKETENVNTQSVSVEEKNKKCDLQLDVELLSPNHSDHIETDGITFFKIIFVQLSQFIYLKFFN